LLNLPDFQVVDTAPLSKLHDKVTENKLIHQINQKILLNIKGFVK